MVYEYNGGEEGRQGSLPGPYCDGPSQMWFLAHIIARSVLSIYVCIPAPRRWRKGFISNDSMID